MRASHAYPTIRIRLAALWQQWWSSGYLVRFGSAVRNTSLLFATYAALAALFTWPLVLHLHNGVTSAVDPVDSIWRIGWGQERLLHAPNALFNGNTFYPFAHSYLFDECIIGVAVLTLPLAIVGVAPLVIYNLAVLLTLTLCGVAMYALARHFGALPFAAFIAGMIYAFAPLHLDRIGHIGVISIQYFPLIILLLDRVLIHQRMIEVLALAACLAMQALSSHYHALYLVLLVPLFLAIMLVRRPEIRRPGVLVHLVGAGAIALALIAPVAIGFLRVRSNYEVTRSYGQIAYYSASLVNFIAPDGNNRLWGPFTSAMRNQGTYTFERGMFAGGIALVLAAAGLWLGRRNIWVVFFAVLASLAALLALGPELRLVPGSHSPLIGYLPYAFLYWHVPAFDSMRVSARIGGLYLLGIAGLAALGLTFLLRWLNAALLSHRPRIARIGQLLASLVILFGIGGEYLGHPLRLIPLESGNAVPPVYRWLATQPEATVLELPLIVPDHIREQSIAVREQYFSLVHKRPIVNGNATVLPKGYKSLVVEMRDIPSPRTVGILQGLGITHVIVHYDQLSTEHAALLREQLTNTETGLTFIEQVGETAVYRVARTDRYHQLQMAIPPGASVALSHDDPMKTATYMAMIGYVLRDHPLYANLRVDFGQEYRGPVVAGARYDCVALFAHEDPTAYGFTPGDLVWQDNIARVYRKA